MLFIIFSLKIFVAGIATCKEKIYENIILDPTNPFYKESFQMNQNDFNTYTDALGFGFWSQYRPYQDIQGGYEVDYSFEPTYQLNGNLLLSIRNTDTNQFETVYFLQSLQSPFFTTQIYHQMAQRQQSYIDQKPFTPDNLRYEGMWVYTHFQFIPLQQLIYVYFLSYGQLTTNTFLFQFNQYGNKEIIIGGSGRIFNYYNLGIFHGRMSKPIQLQLQQFFANENEFWNYYSSCMVPKSCSGPIKIDIIRDQTYMDSTMYYTQTIKLYENTYSFGGWVKVDISNIITNTLMLLIRATINKDYKNNEQLGDKSFYFEYFIDVFRNMSAINVEQYSYSTPLQGYIGIYGKSINYQFLDAVSTVQNNMQQWHFIKFFSGMNQQYQKQAKVEIFFPIIQKTLNYQFFQYDIGGNQFTTDYLYLHIGVDKYSITSQFKGWIQDFQIWTCMDVTSTPVQISCHFTCLPTIWCLPEKKCEQCPIDSHRQFFQITKSCECQEGYYSVENQPICENFIDNFQFLQFSSTQLISFEQCQLGEYQYQNQCYQCPFKIQDNHVSCLECLNNKRTWYLNPICESDYVKLIGDSDEPFFPSSRSINGNDLFKINSFNYLELCQGCYKYCDSLSSDCFLSNYYHLEVQMIVKCKQNYYFDQSKYYKQFPLDILECNKCINNCEICDLEGQCIQCIQQHYFDPNLKLCLECDIRCDQCQYDQQLDQQVCISCPNYFTLYNGICLKCGVYCQFCQPAFYQSTGEVYARCFQCIDHKKYFISFDAINCHQNMILNCLYEFQYYQNDKHIQTIDMIFEPRALDSTIKTACAKCSVGYIYIIEGYTCLYFNQYIEYSIVQNYASTIVALSADYAQAQTYTTIQITGGIIYIQNCYGQILSKTDQMIKCTMCNTGFYVQKLRGNCIKCPAELNCQDCEQQQKINKDYFKLEFKPFYEYFVNFDGLHNYEDYAQSSNVEDFEIVCTVCLFGYQPIDGRCVKDCPENCAECIYNNGQLQCLRCYENIQGIMQTLVNNECIQCPFNCGVCLPQDPLKVYQYNPYFSNTQYQYFTNLCLSLIKQLPTTNYFYDPDIGNYIECLNLQQCTHEVHFEMIVHCNDQQFEQLLQSSSNQIQFQQQNIKLSQLFSTATDPHVPEYQNDIVYLRLNQKSIKKINQTFIFTNYSECVISEKSRFQNQFSKNVYSLRETYVNFIGIQNNVKVYFSNQLYLDGFTHILFQNMELISTALNPLNSIIISHLINVKISLETIKFSTLSSKSTISFQALNSSDLTINKCLAANLNYIQNNFFNIQNPLWQFNNLYHNDIMNLVIDNFSLINCTFKDSSIIHNILDNQYILSFRNIFIQAEFINSFLFTQLQTMQFSNKIVLLDSINIESNIYDTNGFFDFQYIDAITISQLSFINSIISNSIFIKGNSQFEFDHLYFSNLQMIGHSILLKYEATQLGKIKYIGIATLTISEVSYEQINSFIQFVDQNANNQLDLTYLSLEGNYLANHLQKSYQEIFYYSALIYIEMLNVNIMNSNILRMAGFYEFALVNTQNITFENLTINQKEQIKGLHQYLDCQQKQNYSNVYFSVISIFKAKYTLLTNIQANHLVLYNYPLISYQSIDASQNIQSEIFIIQNSRFSSNIILITQDIKSNSIVMIKSEQLIEINMNDVTFTQNQLHSYLISKSINACLINFQCLNGTVIFDQLNAIYNLVTNDTHSLFYVNMKSILLKNSSFLRNNIFDYEKIKGNLMWSFPNNISQITIESLQNLFPIKSDGLFMILFEVLIINNITIRLQQGCKGGAFQLYSQQNGIFNISNSIINNIMPSLNCDQSFGGALYLDSTKSKLVAIITQISIDHIMSLNLGGFLYVLSATSELNITISHIVANNYQSLKGSFLYASLQQSKGLAQEINIYNCSLTNQFPDFINYLGYLSIFQNLDTSNLLKDRVQFFFVNGRFSMKNIVIHVLNYESFINVSGCINMDFSQLYFGRGNYTNNPLLNIEFNSIENQMLNLYDIQVQNLEIIQDTLCLISQALNITKLTLMCQQNFNDNLPVNLQQLITTEYLQDKGLCYLEAAFQALIWETFSIIKISSTQIYNTIRINKIQFQNIQCTNCQYGLLNVNFEQGKNNLVEIIDVIIFNSYCGNLGCLVFNQGQIDYSTLLLKTNSRLLNTLEKDYYNMNFSFKIYKYTCLKNIAHFGVCLFVHNTELQVIDSHFLNNTAINSGGAVYTTNSIEQISLIRTILEYNSADLGNSVIYMNQLMPNLTQTQSFSNYSKNHSQYLVGVPQKLKITKSNHLYYQMNEIQYQTSDMLIDLSTLDSSFYFPNGQSLASYLYFDIKSEEYIQTNLSFRLIALNIFGQEQTQISGTKCKIYSRMIENLQDNTEFNQNYTNLKSIEFNITTKDYNLDELILLFDSDLQQRMFLQLQFICDSIKVPIYLENDPYNINSWHDQYFLRTSLIKPLPCQIGEIKQLDTHICQLCDSRSGFYSVTLNSGKCQSKNDLTMINVTSAQINLRQFYWRPYINSDFIENCFNLQSNCEGSWHHGDKSCFVGHIGALCEQCDLYNIRGDGQYSVSSNFVCGSCTSIGQNILLITLVSIFTLLSIIISVKSTDDLILDLNKWKKYVSTGILISNEKAMAGILIKILTNYLQIVGSLSTFKIQMPIWISQVIISSADPIQSMAYSLDCFLIDMFQIPILYSRILWQFIMTIIYIWIAIVLFYLINLKSKKKLRQGIISTILIYTIIFLQPNIFKCLISSISYRNISGYKWVQGLVAYRYDSHQHQTWLPLLISLLYIVGMFIPGYFYYKLFKIRHKLNNIENRSTWGFLYNEYTKWAYYWEIVKIFLKEIIIFLLTYYEDSIFVKAILMNLFIILYKHYLHKWKPYNLLFLNKLEALSSSTCSISMMVGLCIYASQQQKIRELEYPLFLILFICNLIFLRKILFKILIAYVNKFQLQIDSLKEKIKQKFPKMQKHIPYCYELLENKTEKKKLTSQNFRRIVRQIIRQQQTEIKIAREIN